MGHAVHAHHMPHIPRRGVALLTAFVIGGGAAVGIVAISGGLSDSNESSAAPTLIIHSSDNGQAAGSLDQAIGARP